MTRKIAMIGVGLIGGSLALCFKGKPDVTVVGYAHLPELKEKYIASGVVDDATLSLEDAVKDADFIFLCVPVGLLESYFKQLAALPLKKGASSPMLAARRLPLWLAPSIFV